MGTLEYKYVYVYIYIICSLNDIDDENLGSLQQKYCQPHARLCT